MIEKEKILEVQNKALSEEMEGVLSHITDNLMPVLPVAEIDMLYFMLGVIEHKDNDLYRRLVDSLTSSSIDYIYKCLLEVINTKALSAYKTGKAPKLADSFADAIGKASEEAESLGSDTITSEHIFLAILSINDKTNKIRALFTKAGLTYKTMKGKLNKKTPTVSDKKVNFFSPSEHTKIINFSNPEDAVDFLRKIGNDDNDIYPQTKSKDNIKSFCTNLNDLVKKGKIGKLIGREKETSEIIRVLGRKKKNNVVLVGGEGVGKTAIGENVAYLIEKGMVPSFMLGRKLVSLDMTAIMAGTTLRGMFEERVKGILDEIKADPSYILFIDNIGAALANNNKNDMELSSMLSNSLDNGEIQVIGTSDFKSYRRTFDKDPSLARKFQKIIVEAPSIEESKKILKGIQEDYEKHHKVKYTDEAIDSCVLLANKYITERNLPDSAIDILDESGALNGTIKESPTITILREEIFELKEKNKKGEYNEQLREAEEKYEKVRKEYEKEKRKHPPLVTKEDILNIVSIKTNIPSQNLSMDDKEKLLNINKRIKEKVIGQDDAIDTICKAIKRSRVGLRKNGCMYSYMSIGGTGTGKTLIAKQLAKELFGDEKALVRFDMSEYSDKASANKLIGSNPGYVGYEEGGRLTESIKNKKHCILLLDEIEKADAEVYNLFLQLLDEGFLTDNSGQRVDFKNVIVIFTSNIGVKTASDFGKGVGFNKVDTEIKTKNILLKELRNKFPPEFLNRIDDIVYFNSLTDENLKSIITLELNKLNERLTEIGYKVKWNDKIVDFIFEKIKEEKEFGARPIMRTIQKTIEDKITDTILEKDHKEGYVFKATLKGKEMVVS